MPVYPGALRIARHSGIIPRSPPVGCEGGHFNVVARRGRHWAVHQPLARSQHGNARTRSRPQFSLFLKEAFGKVQLASLRFCVLAQSQKLTVIGLGLRTSTRKFCGSSATEETVEPIR